MKLWDLEKGIQHRREVKGILRMIVKDSPRTVIYAGELDSKQFSLQQQKHPEECLQENF